LATWAGLAAAFVLGLLASGCSTTIEKSEIDWKAERAYQAIANALPDADVGFGTAPTGILAMAASTRDEVAPKEDLSVFTNEEAFKIRLELLRPRLVRVPYTAVERVQVSWLPFPNVLLALPLILPLQANEARVVFDARKIPGLLEEIQSDCDRLERLSGQAAVATPYYHAQQIREKMREDAELFGEGRLSITFIEWTPVPAWLPWLNKVRRLASAFVWARDAARQGPSTPSDRR
jgi:hypothetical protein